MLPSSWHRKAGLNLGAPGLTGRKDRPGPKLIPSAETRTIGRHAAALLVAVMLHLAVLALVFTTGANRSPLPPHDAGVAMLFAPAQPAATVAVEPEPSGPARPSVA